MLSLKQLTEGLSEQLCCLRDSDSFVEALLSSKTARRSLSLSQRRQKFRRSLIQVTEALLSPRRS